jgi:hypothetical protein
MLPDDATPDKLVDRALVELDRILERYRQLDNPGRLMADLARWKRLISQVIREHISPAEAAEFERLDIHPASNALEAIDGPVGRHRDHLESLREALRQAPPRQPVAQEVPLPEGPRPVLRPPADSHKAPATASPSRAAPLIGDDSLAGAVIDKAMDEVQGIRLRYRLTPNDERIVVDLMRWKRRTSDALREHVSAGEADVFDQLELRPGSDMKERRSGDGLPGGISYMARETLDDVIERHLTFLGSLRDDVPHHPPRSQKRPDALLFGAFMRFLEKEKRERGILWSLVAVILALAISVLGFFFGR